MTLVDLTANERAVVEFVGRRKHEQTRGSRNRLRGRVTALSEEIDATGAELAAAKHLNLYPTSLEGRRARADVGLHYQVRSTRHAGGHLIVHPEDPPGHRFVLVIVLDDGLYDVRGSISHGEAARREARIDPYGHRGWWVPQYELREAL